MPPGGSSTATSPSPAGVARRDQGATAATASEARRALIAFAVDGKPIGWPIVPAVSRFLLDGLASGRPIVARYGPDGEPLAAYQHPTALAAAAADAAAAPAAGLLDRAGDSTSRVRYYGAVGLVVGRLWFDTDRLGGGPS